MSLKTPPPELAPLVARLRRGELLAAGGFALALIAGIAWTRGMAAWIVIGLMAMSAATSVIAVVRIVPTVVAIRRLGERERRK
jgi:hypothetical protein